MDLKIGDIQETALITLAIRASETDRPNARIKDLKAKEIIDTLGVDVSKYDPFMSHEGVVARTIMYKNQLEALIRQYPDALCINLGCGFDDKFVQVDNGEIAWYDVDLPDILAVRRKIYHDRDRCVMKEGSALESDWTVGLPKRSTTIVVMEGVLEYFTKDQVATCLNMLCNSFNHGQKHQAPRCGEVHQRPIPMGHQVGQGISRFGATHEPCFRAQLQRRDAQILCPGKAFRILPAILEQPPGGI